VGRERVTENASADALVSRRARLPRLMVLVLPGFGRWASAMRDFETPYGKAGIRQLEVLYVLRHELLDPTVPTATALAEHFQIQRSVLTRILAKLEAGGYITREPDPADARAWRIAITENGRLLSDYVERQYFQEMSQALGEVGESDIACLERSLEILRRVAANLGIKETVRRIDAVPDR
jgi:DNA-binding MarR family transcriptional regulator